MLIEKRATDAQSYELAKQAGLTDVQAQIVAARMRFENLEQVRQFMQPSLADSLPPPHLMKDMEKAAERFAQAIIGGETIALSTDFDSDGCSSCSILYSALINYFSVPRERIVPHVSLRMKHGYGLSKGAVDEIFMEAFGRKPPTLLITADHGSSDQVGVEYYLEKMKEQGMSGDVIITDHHEIPSHGHPKAAYACCNPKREDCTYPEPSVCGAVVAYLLVAQTRKVLLEKGWQVKPNHGVLLSYGGLATISDVMDLRRPANRAIVQNALKQINRKALPAWSVLKQEASNQTVWAETLAFGAAAAINAASRTGRDGWIAVQFMTAITNEMASKYWLELKKANKERQDIEASLLEDAITIAQWQNDNGRKTLVVYLKNGHAGVNGIVCSRIKDRFGKPTIVLSPVSGAVTGSARSIEGFDIREAMEKTFEKYKDICIKFGGHEQAAGLTVYPEKVSEFIDAFEDVAGSMMDNVVLGGVIRYDFDFTDYPINELLYAELQRLEPYGQKFEKPLFVIRAKAFDLKPIGANKNHLRMKLQTKHGSIAAMWFRFRFDESEPIPIEDGLEYRFVVTLSKNYFNGQSTLQLLVEYVEL